MKAIRFLLALFSLLPAFSVAAQDLAREVDFDIPAQGLPAAVLAFSEQSGLQIVTAGEDLARFQSPRVQGRLQIVTALERLLSETKLAYKLVANGTIALVGRERPTAGNAVSSHDARAMRLAQAPEASTSTSGSAESLQLEEIVVTAQKRTERLQDVPVPVTAISGQALVDSNQLSLRDYYARVPGLSLTSAIAGQPNLAIRGLTTSAKVNPTIGIVVDEVPFGSMSQYGGGGAALDFDPSDLERVEVLRGPQGTLYGANSLGGLLKFVSVDPATDVLRGRLQAGLNSVHNADELGFSVRGSVNVPVSESLAVRASGFTREDPGYIDIPAYLGDSASGAEGVNQEETRGGRLSALWRPSDGLSLKISALLHDKKGAGRSAVSQQAGAGELEQVSLRNTGQYRNKAQVYSATLQARIGQSELTSISGYGINELLDVTDYTASFGFFTEFGDGLFGGTFPGFGVSGTSLPGLIRTEKLTQELRLATALGDAFEWRIGAFYNDEQSRTVSDFLAIDPVSGATRGSWYHRTLPYSFEEFALFTDLTWQVTDRLDIQFGGRGSENRQSYAEHMAGQYNISFGGRPDPYVVSGIRSQDSFFTYLVTPRIKFSQHLMTYARFASGYRPGGPNFSPVVGAPASYDPDTTRNYELGVKGDFFNRALSVDASLFYIDWDDIQILAFAGFPFYENAGAARSQGVELAVEARPLPGLSIAAWVVWNDAELSEDFASTSTSAGTRGDPLPFASRWSGNLAVDHEFPLANGFTGFVGGTASYVDERPGEFKSFLAPPQTPRAAYPSYVRVDLRAGLKRGSWTLNAFVNNVGDERGILSVDPDLALTVFIQPRTAGLSLMKEW